ncbi:putative Nucleosome assembly protein [Babesia divergens]|uniref:Nucleosome assembly protein n=1 Tax=Babesia divergens TaxID=32595 RepID=A0AAD9GHB1_BABDI|nr:putative Nucleosome assembly protein [Babesia divergens]
MEDVKPLVRKALSDIHKEEVEAIKEYNESLNQLIEGLKERLSGLADRRVEALTDPSALTVSAKIKLSAVQQCFNEMSLREISGTSKPVDERYQQHGTPAWPRFWLHALLGCGITRRRISTVDRQLLSYLRDIRCTDVVEDGQVEGLHIEFIFAENPFFANASLTREIKFNGTEEESQASAIEWKENAVELVEEVSALESGDEFDEESTTNNTYGSFFDFFQPFEDTYWDAKMANAIRERICSNPLKYAMRYEENKRNDKMEDSEPEDEEEANRHATGGRYPFSWLLSLATSRF